MNKTGSIKPVMVLSEYVISRAQIKENEANRGLITLSILYLFSTSFL
ncbi:MAG: hypothetical protein K6E34_08570 [Lachnospiraceae bacterium]|nr:hypothetical protein [Lachnospiraceae bacterium]